MNNNPSMYQVGYGDVAVLKREVEQDIADLRAVVVALQNQVAKLQQSVTVGF